VLERSDSFDGHILLINFDIIVSALLAHLNHVAQEIILVLLLDLRDVREVLSLVLDGVGVGPLADQVVLDGLVDRVLSGLASGMKSVILNWA